MEFFYVVKATQKSGKGDAVIWFTAKSEARANLQLDVELEDAGIETGRGKDFQKPIRTDFPVYDDLPEESTVDYAWCKRYELDEDQRTWQKKVKVEEKNHTTSELESGSSTALVEKFREQETPTLFTVATLPLRHRILAEFLAEEEYAYHIDAELKNEVQRLAMDVDNSYVQNLLLAAENVDGFKIANECTIWKAVNAVKNVFPQEKRSELATLIHFLTIWFATDHIDRGILVREWAVGSPWLLHHVTSSGNVKASDQVGQNSLSVSFKLAIDSTGISVKDGKTMPTFHEQRSLSERLYEEQGINTQQLLGHSSDRMTAQYHNDRGLDWMKVKV